MRGLDTPGVGTEALADVSPTGAAFAEGFTGSLGPQMASIADMLSTSSNNNIKNHVELNQIFPDASEKFTESMPLDKARFIYERQLVQRQYQQNMQYGTNTDAFVGSALGGLADPVGNAIGVLGGAAVKAAGYLGTSMAGRIGTSMAENFIGNSIADVAAYKTSDMLKDEYDFGERVKANLAGSVLFGTLGGLAHHYFRESPEFGAQLEKAAENRGATGLDPESVKPIYDAHMAAENSAAHYPYEHGPFDQNAPFYSGSKHYTEDFNQAGHVLRDSEMGREQGVQMFSNENFAHAGALTEGSGPTGAVFEHNIADKKLADGNIPLSELGYPEAIKVVEKAMNSDARLPNNLFKIRDMTTANAYREVLKAHYRGDLSLTQVMQFEGALNADGIHFQMNDFRGQVHEPSHGVYLFDRGEAPHDLNNGTKNAFKVAGSPTGFHAITPTDNKSFLVKNGWRPTTWSEFSPSREQLGNVEFQKRLEGSKIVSGEGSPLVVYHGRSREFKGFNQGLPRHGAPEGTNRGFYFTDRFHEAAGYAGGGHAEESQVVPVYLDIKNPKIFNEGANAALVSLTDERIAHYKAEGYDGLMLKDMQEIVAFDKEQIIPAIPEGTPMEATPGMPNDSGVVGFKPAEPLAVGKMDKERLMSIKTHVNGEERIFNYEKKFNKYGQEMWTEIKNKALQQDPNQLALPVDQAETKLDNSFQEAKQRITEADQFEGHVDEATKRALLSATEDFKHANTLSKIYSTIKACLR